MKTSPIQKALIFSLLLFCKMLFGQSDTSDVISYITKDDTEIQGLLSSDIEQGNLIAKESVIGNAAKWIADIVRPDWIPTGIESKMQPLRIAFPFTPPRKIDTLLFRIPAGDGNIDIYENREVFIIWHDSGIAITNDPEKQSRMLLRTILNNYSGSGKFVVERHLDGKLIHGGITELGSPPFPTSWSQSLSFWLSDGLMIIRLTKVSPRIKNDTVNGEYSQAQASNEDWIRFEKK